MSDEQPSESENQTYGWRTPFIVTKQKFGVFSIYVIVLIMTCFGIGIHFILPLFAEAYTTDLAWDSTLRTGSFYLVIISLLVTSIAQMNDNWEGRSLPPTIIQIKKVVWSLALLIMVACFVMGALEVVFQKNTQPLESFTWLTRDYSQIVLFILGLIVATYSFLLITYEVELDQFAEETIEAKRELQENANKTDKDEDGMRY